MARSEGRVQELRRLDPARGVSGSFWKMSTIMDQQDKEIHLARIELVTFSVWG